MMGKTVLAKGGRDKIVPFLCKLFPQPEVCCGCFRPGEELMRLKTLQSTVWQDYLLLSLCLNKSYFLHRALPKFQTSNGTEGDLSQAASTQTYFT